MSPIFLRYIYSTKVEYSIFLKKKFFSVIFSFILHATKHYINSIHSSLHYTVKIRSLFLLTVSK